MATINSSSLFISWTLSQEELEMGCNFSSTQRQFIQNLISEYAHEKVKLTFSKGNKQREAELQGSILALQYILDSYSLITQQTEIRS
jgi:hypothetical protein